MLRFIFCLLLVTSINADDTQSTITEHSFKVFLDNVSHKAITQGISKATLEKAFKNLTIDPRILKLDRSQAEFNQNFWHYLNIRVSRYRIDNGVKVLAQHQTILKNSQQKYPVAPHIIVAFWGMESNYGTHTGKFDLIRSLATLSFDKRRSAFFTDQLLTLLALIDTGKIPINAKGSWAGAMGNVQFIPSNVATYGVDVDLDGKIDLWNNKADIITSAAKFLQKIGWHFGERWGREVRIPDDFDYKLAQLNVKKNC